MRSNGLCTLFHTVAVASLSLFILPLYSVTVYLYSAIPTFGILIVFWIWYAWFLSDCQNMHPQLCVLLLEWQRLEWIETTIHINIMSHFLYKTILQCHDSKWFEFVFFFVNFAVVVIVLVFSNHQVTSSLEFNSAIWNENFREFFAVSQCNVF